MSTDTLGTTSAPTIKAIDTAATESTDLAFDEAALDVTVAFVERLWARWHCQETCPGRPAYDAALSDIINDPELGEKLADTARDWLLAKGRAFADQHPEASRPAA